MNASVWNLAVRVLEDVVGTLARTWPYLLISVVAAAVVTTYVGTDRIAGFLTRRVWVATGAAVLLATLTPFCSCGTTAVLLGMMASASPWAPLVAFMVSSPLTSPSELVFSAGLFGWEFAMIFFVGTIALGLTAGGVTFALERTGWLRGQARVQPIEATCGSACEPAQPVPVSMGPGAAAVDELRSQSSRLRLGEFGREFLLVGRRLLLFFLAFASIGYLMIEAIPTEWLVDYLGGDSLAAVPLAAVLGIPAYLNSEASLPLVATLMEGGMGPGPAMAFLVTGAGTSVGAITGLLVIARARVVWLVVSLLFVGALSLGWLAQLLM